MAVNREPEFMWSVIVVLLAEHVPKLTNSLHG